MAEIKGVARITLRVEGEYDLSALTEGWSDEEKEALLAGEDDAEQALEDVMTGCSLRDPDECETEFLEIERQP